jgi:hypothetical protein
MSLGGLNVISGGKPKNQYSVYERIEYSGRKLLLLRKRRLATAFFALDRQSHPQGAVGASGACRSEESWSERRSLS